MRTSGGHSTAISVLAIMMLDSKLIAIGGIKYKIWRWAVTVRYFLGLKEETAIRL